MTYYQIDILIINFDFRYLRINLYSKYEKLYVGSSKEYSSFSNYYVL